MGLLWAKSFQFVRIFKVIKPKKISIDWAKSSPRQFCEAEKSYKTPKLTELNGGSNKENTETGEC